MPDKYILPRSAGQPSWYTLLSCRNEKHWQRIPASGGTLRFANSFVKNNKMELMAANSYLRKYKIQNIWTHYFTYFSQKKRNDSEWAAIFFLRFVAPWLSVIVWQYIVVFRCTRYDLTKSRSIQFYDMELFIGYFLPFI